MTSEAKYQHVVCFLRTIEAQTRAQWPRARLPLTLDSTAPTVSTEDGLGNCIDSLFDAIFEYLVLGCSLRKHPIEHESVLLWPISRHGSADTDRLLVVGETDDGLSPLTVFNRVLGTEPAK